MNLVWMKMQHALKTVAVSAARKWETRCLQTGIVYVYKHAQFIKGIVMDLQCSLYFSGPVLAQYLTQKYVRLLLNCSDSHWRIFYSAKYRNRAFQRKLRT